MRKLYNIFSWYKSYTYGYLTKHEAELRIRLINKCCYRVVCLFYIINFLKTIIIIGNRSKDYINIYYSLLYVPIICSIIVINIKITDKLKKKLLVHKNILIAKKDRLVFKNKMINIQGALFAKDIMNKGNGSRNN